MTIIKKSISKFLTLANALTSRLIHGLSFLMPRTSKIWVFIGWHRNKEREIFADNSKYLFLYVANNLKHIKAIWIGKDKKITAILRNRGYNAHKINSFKGVYYSLRAKYTFIDAFMELKNWRLSGGSKIIQLWHGKGLKKTGYDSPYGLQRRNKLLLPNLFCTLYYRTIASSKYTAKLMASIFRIPKETIIITGLPRHDVLFKNIKGADIDITPFLKTTLKNIRQKNINKIILYAPTFRPDGSNPLSQLKLDEFNYFLRKKNNHLVIMLHPKFAIKKYSPPRKKNTNITFVEAGYDIYPLLSQFDVLITDYSSLYVDFLLLDKPVIFFVYDLEKYKKEMGLYDKFMSLMPGPHATNFKELLAALQLKTDKYKKARQRARRYFFRFIDGKITSYILSQKN